MRRAKNASNNWAIAPSAGAFEPARLELDRQSQTPVYRQICDRICDAIMRGVLRPGDRLPSSRSLASQLATSRGTVDLAYSLLAGEGYILGQGAAGTVVAALAKPASSPIATTPAHTPSAVAPFQMGMPALDAFPHKLWTRISVRRARMLSVHSIAAPDPAGYAPLREAVASYLAVSRGILCSPDQVIIASGFLGALGLITRAFLAPGDAVWFEDPGYFMARIALRLAGANLVGVPVDAEGLDVSAGIARSPHARFAYVTPSHQSPLGMALSSSRRAALLSWAASTGAWVIEDDYDSEFHYGSRPLPALKSVDQAGRVLYVGTFSKVLLPGLRLGYLVVPESEIERLRRLDQTLYRDLSTLNQAIVADFMTEGHFARHIKRMRKLYADRRAALASALIQVFGDRIDLQLQDGGMHLLARFPGCKNDVDLVARAKALGLAPAPLTLWQVDRDCGPGLLLSFTNIPQKDSLAMARRLRQALEP